MKTLQHILFGFLLVNLVSISSLANATIIDFDSITNSSTYQIGNNTYDGLTFSSSWYILNSSSTSLQNSGYHNGTVSPSYVAYNGYGNDVSITSATPFNFNGAYLTAAWNTGLNIKISGLLNGILAYSQTISVNPSSPTYFDLNFNNIDMLSFSSFGGTNAGLGGVGNHFAIDNFTFNETLQPSPTPEPATMLLMGIGIAGGALMRKRMKQSEV